MNFEVIVIVYNSTMRYSTFKEEQRLWEKGYQLVAGIDEVGRGPLAGPVVACAVVFLSKRLPKRSLGRRPKLRLGLGTLRDSKQLSQKQREEFYKILVNHPHIAWGVGRVYPSVIDRINIFEATKLAMERAVFSLQKKLEKPTLHPRGVKYGTLALDIDFLILDGNMKIDVAIPQTAMVKADEKVFSCAAASIIAKVKRDRLMERYHKKYSLYGFDKHKGYGTKLHIASLKEHGPCNIHRRSFAPLLA